MVDKMVHVQEMGPLVVGLPDGDCDVVEQPNQKEQQAHTKSGAMRARYLDETLATMDWQRLSLVVVSHE
jgi:hypothetical protein